MKPTVIDNLREEIRLLIIDPDRLEFGETKVNLRVGGTVDRIMAKVQDYATRQTDEARIDQTNTLLQIMEIYLLQDTGAYRAIEKGLAQLSNQKEK